MKTFIVTGGFSLPVRAETWNEARTKMYEYFGRLGVWVYYTDAREEIEKVAVDQYGRPQEVK